MGRLGSRYGVHPVHSVSRGHWSGAWGRPVAGASGGVAAAAAQVCQSLRTLLLVGVD